MSRQVGALEQDLGAPLFHRHARGLILTEQGEMLREAVHDVVLKLDAVRSRLIDTREKPHGQLRVTSTLVLGANWLSPRLGEFVELYPEVMLQLLLSDDELDLSMREADVALRFGEPMQPDLIRRRLFTVHFHAYASADYLKKTDQPRTIADLDKHRLVAVGAPTATHLLRRSQLAADRRARAKSPRAPHIAINNLSAIIRAVEHGVGIAVLPDYCVAPNSGLVRLLPQADMPEMDCFLVYAEEMKNVARVQAFRDFLVAKAQRWQLRLGQRGGGSRFGVSPGLERAAPDRAPQAFDQTFSTWPNSRSTGVARPKMETATLTRERCFVDFLDDVAAERGERPVGDAHLLSPISNRIEGLGRFDAVRDLPSIRSASTSKSPSVPCRQPSP